MGSLDFVELIFFFSGTKLGRKGRRHFPRSNNEKMLRRIKFNIIYLLSGATSLLAFRLHERNRPTNKLGARAWKNP